MQNELDQHPLLRFFCLPAGTVCSHSVVVVNTLNLFSFFLPRVTCSVFSCDFSTATVLVQFLHAKFGKLKRKMHTRRNKKSLLSQTMFKNAKNRIFVKMSLVQFFHITAVFYGGPPKLTKFRIFEIFDKRLVSKFTETSKLSRIIFHLQPNPT